VPDGTGRPAASRPSHATWCAPAGSDPSEAEFVAAQPVERGPAYGTLNADSPASEWPLYRGNPERSSSSKLPSVYTYTPSWQTPVLTPHANGLLDHSIVSLTLATLSPPVVGCGKLFVAATNRGEIVALNEQSGVEEWRYRAGGRVQTSPTVYGNGCFFGSNDGYVYALSAADGSLMWRTRLAPRERRMLEHGLPESNWPVFGSVLAYRGLLFASAGRNSEADGGVVVVALNPATGERAWSRHLGVVMQRKNDLLSVSDDGRIVWHSVKLDPMTGQGDIAVGRILSAEGAEAHSGMWDNTHMYMPGSRRTGTVYTVDKTSGWMMAWNHDRVVDGNGAIRSRTDTTSGARSGGRRRGPVFDAATQPTAVVACAKSALAGYGESATTKGRIVVLNGGGVETASIPLSAGVQHNGIAVTRNGIAVSLEDGTVAFLKNARLPDKNAGYVQRVNCAGKEYKDSRGTTWSADREYAPNAYGHVGGGGYDRTPDYGLLAERVSKDGNVQWATRKTVAGPDPYLYMTELSALSQYRFTVPNGHYEVVLHFAETYFSNDMYLPNGDLCWMRRRFDVALNGTPILSDFSPADDAGGKSHVPVVKRFETDVADGDITIAFGKIENSPIINAVEIIATPTSTALRVAPAAGHAAARQD